MARPPLDLDGYMAIIGYGRLTVAEVSRLTGTSRFTLYRRCKALGIDAEAARNGYARHQIAMAEGRSLTPANKATLRRRAERAMQIANGHKPSDGDE